METIGQRISTVLVEVENILWDYEIRDGAQPCYPDEAFRATTKIFLSVLMDRIWELKKREGISLDDVGGMATKAGEDFRKLIKTYTDIDTHSLYK